MSWQPEAESDADALGRARSYDAARGSTENWRPAQPPLLPTYLHTYLSTYLPTYLPTYLNTYLCNYLRDDLPKKKYFLSGIAQIS